MNKAFHYLFFVILAIGVGQTGVAGFKSPTHSKEITKKTPNKSSSKPTNLWVSVRTGFQLDPHSKHHRVNPQTKWLTKSQRDFNALIKKTKPYLYYVHQEVKKRQMPMEIALLPIVESAYDPFAHSHVGAAGLWQLMPRTAKSYGLKQNWWYDDRRDIHASTKVALDHLAHLHKLFKGDWLLAIAAYNAGEGSVKKAIKQNQRKGKKTDFWSLSLPKQTAVYVPRLLALARIVKNPNHYSVTIPPISNRPHFTKVEVGKAFDLVQTAQLVNMPHQELYRLNAGFNRFTSAPNGPYTLVLPVEKVSLLNRQKSQLFSAATPSSLVKHTVRPGNTLSGIAEQYHTSISALKRANQLQNHLIRAGHKLIIPSTSASASTAHSTKVVHTIRKGDTLWDIAHQYQVRLTSLRSWNNLPTKHTLQPGNQLTIWPKHV